MSDDPLARLEALLIQQIEQQEKREKREDRRYEHLLTLLASGQGKDIDVLKKKLLITLL